jgi:CBS domain-containing protein
MRAAPTSVAAGDSLARAARLMESVPTRELPVTEGRRLVGILTRTDMEPYRGHFEWTLVRVAMTLDPVTVPPEAPIGDVVTLLLDRGFNSVPVCAGGELQGMIARSDVLRTLAASP